MPSETCRSAAVRYFADGTAGGAAAPVFAADINRNAAGTVCLPLLEEGKARMQDHSAREAVSAAPAPDASLFDAPAADERMAAVNFGLNLIEKKRGMTFGTDALLLAAFARRKAKGRAADFGAGTGVVALLCAKCGKFGRIYAVERQPAYHALSLRNTALNGENGRVIPLCADIRTLKAGDFGGELDAVLTNPPYMTVHAGRPNADQGRYAARHETAGDIGDFCEAARRCLKHGGAFYAVYRPDRLTDLLCAMRASALEPKRLIFVCRDQDHAPSLVLAEGRKGGAPGMYVPPPLLLCGDADEQTAALQAIYEKGDFEDAFQRS